jgi:cyclopropane fatty-acyl-phospholipid synthase-like methyltransferase
VRAPSPASSALSTHSLRAAHKIYSDAELATIPRAAVDRALSVANHLRYAGIQRTETILDVGCRAGIDTILAAQRTGPAGRVRCPTTALTWSSPTA